MAFETSDSYKEAINKTSRTSTVTGKLTTKSGVEIQIDNSTIDSGSLYITNQCVSRDAFAYGSVFAAELGIRLKTDIDRYSLYDAAIELNYNLMVGPGSYETIPLGKYYVSDPTRSGGAISIKAYDGMIILEEEIIESTTGTAYELLELISHNLGIELAQTKEEVEALVNGTIVLSLDKDRVKTYRDLVANISMITCTFAVFDRYGKLKLCSYGTEVTKNLDIRQKTASKFSDFTTYYSGAKGKFLESGTYVQYYKSEEGDGLVYDLGEVPIVQGVSENNQKVLDDIFENLKNVRYVPCDITFSGDPSVDLGDMMHNVDYKGNEFNSLVTYYKWTYRGSEQIKSAGANPKLSKVKDKNGGLDIGQVESEIDKKTVAIYTYTNSKDIYLKYEEEVKHYKEVVRIAYAATENTTAIFMATIPVVMDKDGYVEFSMYIDGIYYDDSTITQYCHKGRSVVTFVNYLSSRANHSYRITVIARAMYTGSVEREHDAELKTRKNATDAVIVAFNELTEKLKTSKEIPYTELPEIKYNQEEVDTSHPTGKIEKYGVKAVVFGQGLAGKVDWDGTIGIIEGINLLEFTSNFGFANITDSVSSVLKTPTASSLEEHVSMAFSSNFTFASVVDIVGERVVIKDYTFSTMYKENYTYDKYITANNDMFALKTIYNYESAEESIDSGKMCAVAIDYSGLTVESVVVE